MSKIVITEIPLGASDTLLYLKLKLPWCLLPCLTLTSIQCLVGENKLMSWISPDKVHALSILLFVCHCYEITFYTSWFSHIAPTFDSYECRMQWKLKCHTILDRSHEQRERVAALLFVYVPSTGATTPNCDLKYHRPSTRSINSRRVRRNAWCFPQGGVWTSSFKVVQGVFA